MIYSQFSHFPIHLFIYLFIGYLLLAIIFTKATTEQKSTYHCCLETYGGHWEPLKLISNSALLLLLLMLKTK